MSETAGNVKTGQSERRVNVGVRLFCRWLFGDVSYVVLPLIVLAVIYVLLGYPFYGFAQKKEWSFATIVFFGMAIRRFVHVKTEVQRRSSSFKVDIGIVTFVVGLVLSVLVLSLVILEELGTVLSTHAHHLGLAQIVLFAIASVSLLTGLYAEQRGEWLETGSEANRDAWRRVASNVNNAEDALAAAGKMLDRVESRTDADGKTIRDRKKLSAEIVSTLDRIKELSNEAARRISTAVATEANTAKTAERN